MDVRLSSSSLLARKLRFANSSRASSSPPAISAFAFPSASASLPTLSGFLRRGDTVGDGGLDEEVLGVACFSLRLEKPKRGLGEFDSRDNEGEYEVGSLPPRCGWLGPWFRVGGRWVGEAKDCFTGCVAGGSMFGWAGSAYFP